MLKVPGGDPRSMLELSILLPLVDAVKGNVPVGWAKNEARHYLDWYSQATVANLENFRPYGASYAVRFPSGQLSQIETNMREAAVNQFRLWFDGGKSVVELYPRLFVTTRQKLEGILTSVGLSPADFSMQADAVWGASLEATSEETPEETSEESGLMASLPSWALPVGVGAAALLVLLLIKKREKS